MKKAVLIIGTFLIGLCISSAAIAGSLNEYEAQVIAAANGRYEYNGTEYKVDPVYIAQLRGLLLDDNVDLTEEQMNVVLQSINDYIKTGVEEGYLIPANSGSSASGDAVSEDSKHSDTGSTASTEEKADKSEPSGDEFMGGLLSDSRDASVQPNTKAAEKAGNSSQASGNQTPVTGPEVQDTGKSGTVTKETDPGSQGYNPVVNNSGSNGTNNGSDGINDGSSGTKDGSNGTKDGDDGTKAGSNGTKDGSDGAKDGSNGTKDGSDRVKDGSTDASGNSIIKDTGFNLIRPVIAAVLLGALMLAGIIVTIKCNYFTQADE